MEQRQSSVPGARITRIQDGGPSQKPRVRARKEGGQRFHKSSDRRTRQQVSLEEAWLRAWRGSRQLYL